MRIAAIGDAVVRVETAGVCDGGKFKGGKPQVLAGGVGAISTFLTEGRATVDVYCDGPGAKGWTWLSKLFEQCCKNNRIVWSNSGSVAYQTAALLQDGGLVSCLSSHDKSGSKTPFQGLAGLLDDMARYDVVVVHDLGHGTLNGETEAVIAKIVGESTFSVVDAASCMTNLWGGAGVLVYEHDNALDLFGTCAPFEIRQRVGCKAVFVVADYETVAMSHGNEVCVEITLESEHGPHPVEAKEAFVAGVALGLGQKKSFAEAAMIGLRMARTGKYRKSPLR